MTTYSSDVSGDLTSEAAQTFPDPAVVAPRIVGQPIDQLVSAGDFASFTVVVADTRGVTYQWAFNGATVAGATGDTLLLPAVTAANAGRYTVTVANKPTVTNKITQVTSSPATLTLDTGSNAPTPPLCLTAYSDVGGQVRVDPLQLSYTQNQTVTLTATPSPPAVFVGWSEFVAGSTEITPIAPATNPLTVTMTADTTVRARFAAPLPLPDNLTSWWRGEPTTSPVVLDSISANNGIGPGGDFYTADGKVGGAFAFGGTAGALLEHDAPSLQPAQLTLEVWVWPAATSNFNTIVGRGSPTANADGWWLGLSQGRPQFMLSTTPNPTTLTGTPISISEWTHLAATFDGVNAVLYVNGDQVAAQGDLGEITYGAAFVGIGQSWGNGPALFPFNGRIDEVSLYNRALTCGEIFDIYNADIAGKNYAAPCFTTQSPLPAATEGMSYSEQLATVLGTAPITFTLSDGALPPNVTLSFAGALAGTPTMSGLFDFTVTATDVSGNSTSQLFVLNVSP